MNEYIYISTLYYTVLAAGEEEQLYEVPTTNLAFGSTTW